MHIIWFSLMAGVHLISQSNKRSKQVLPARLKGLTVPNAINMVMIITNGNNAQMSIKIDPQTANM
jgi:hypothetical protein